MRAWFKKKRVSIDDQLNLLQSIGIEINRGIELENCLSFEKRAYEDKPYLLLLMELGSDAELEDGKFLPVSDEVRYFDAECIEGHGDYARVLDKLKALLKAEIEIDHIKDYVDIEEEEARIFFTVNGNAYTYDLAIHDDWLDKEIIAIFSKLLMAYGSKKRLYYAEIDQSLLVVSIAKEHFTGLNQLVNVFVPACLEG
ncbi:hypothetical protein [Paenibacillus glycinis]|uniref:Uncharacterized protein n=1 Tax=Paenibacillus glycinis TaxID=2697035 RepID=A0ABW9XS79_9BACL|nr:hypothetical protein [Paenibacillus glycinis]NBD25401.1 hypothetical protein [Paenibacillus glycinis]